MTVEPRCQAGCRAVGAAARPVAAGKRVPVEIPDASSASWAPSGSGHAARAALAASPRAEEPGSAAAAASRKNAGLACFLRNVLCRKTRWMMEASRVATDSPTSRRPRFTAALGGVSARWRRFLPRHAPCFTLGDLAALSLVSDMARKEK